MSEYQYYEFQAIDRPLNATDLQALRGLSTRARITATSFTNEYHWGDFKGSPVRLMERWFDLHLYLANWGTRRLMIRLPQQLVQWSRLDRFLRWVDVVGIRESGENLIVDIHSDDDGPHYTYEEAGYDRALELLLDLRALAQEDGTLAAFSDRARSIRDRHSRKLRFIERLQQLDQQ